MSPVRHGFGSARFGIPRAGTHPEVRRARRRWDIDRPGRRRRARGPDRSLGRSLALRQGAFVPVDAEILELPAELVLLATGFTGPVVQSGPVQELGLALTPRGTIRVNERFMSSIPGVFSSGDATRGASLIVWAIAEGRKMAGGVDEFLATSR